jgi:chromosome partitioning protein
MIILLGSQKGGVGKSTIASNITVELAKRNYDVILVDSDSQQHSVSDWYSYREEQSGLVKVSCIEKHGNIKNTLLEMSEKYDYVVVDVAGRDTKEMRSAMLCADIMITPLRASQFDINTVSILNDVIDEVLDYNEKLNVKAIVSCAPTNPKISEAIEAKNLLKDFEHICLMDTIIHDRKIYRDAIANGIGVVESDNEKAKFEIEQVVNEILKES